MRRRFKYNKENYKECPLQESQGVFCEFCYEERRKKLKGRTYRTCDKCVLKFIPGEDTLETMLDFLKGTLVIFQIVDEFGHLIHSNKIWFSSIKEDTDKNNVMFENLFGITTKPFYDTFIPKKLLNKYVLKEIESTACVIFEHKV